MLLVVCDDCVVCLSLFGGCLVLSVVLLMIWRCCCPIVGVCVMSCYMCVRSCADVYDRVHCMCVVLIGLCGAALRVAMLRTVVLCIVLMMCCRCCVYAFDME